MWVLNFSNLTDNLLYVTSFCVIHPDFHTDLPDYDPRAKTFDSTLFVARTVSETCPLTPPPESLVGTLTQEWEEKDPLDSYSAATMKATIPAVKGQSGSSHRPTAHSTIGQDQLISVHITEYP